MFFSHVSFFYHCVSANGTRLPHPGRNISGVDYSYQKLLSACHNLRHQSGCLSTSTTADPHVALGIPYCNFAPHPFHSLFIDVSALAQKRPFSFRTYSDEGGRLCRSPVVHD